MINVLYLIKISEIVIMGRKSLKETRQKEILNAFYQVAKKEGIENASVAKVANKLDVNPSLIMHYFKTRDEMLMAFVSFILERYLKIYKSNEEINSKDKLLALIDGLFSRKWNRLFNDSVFYSCYALIYRNKSFKKQFKTLHDSLRKSFAQSLQESNQHYVTNISDINKTVEIVFNIIDGAYYYLGMVDDKNEYETKTLWYKNHVLDILNLEAKQHSENKQIFITDSHFSD
jgi:AcrR family transcriptional regulator